MAALAVAGGSRPSLVVQAPDGPGRIVFVRDGDLFVAESDGSGQTLIASGDAGDAKFGYLTAAWSPDMRHIAAVRDVGGAYLTPGVDLMTADGALVRTVALEAGCGPSMSWSPDSPRSRSRRARPMFHGTPSSRSSQGSGSSSPGWMPPATGRSRCHLNGGQSRARNAEVWIRPDLWARWSPDGRWIALWTIVAGQGGRYLVAADGSGTRRIEELTDDLGDRVDFVDWSPDGRSLAISGELGRLRGRGLPRDRRLPRVGP